jgi:hypothetical protein
VTNDTKKEFIGMAMIYNSGHFINEVNREFMDAVTDEKAYKIAAKRAAFYALALFDEFEKLAGANG